MANLTVAQARSLFESQKDNDFPDISSSTFLEWMNFINDKMYFQLSAMDENRFMTEFVYDVEAGIAKYTKPSDFGFSALKFASSGVFKTRGGSDYLLVRYDTETGNFTAGLTVTGAVSGATGVIDQVQDNGTDGYLVLSAVTDEFEDGEAITDTSTGAAVVDGDPRLFSKSTSALQKVHPYSSNLGYSVDSTDIQFVPMPTSDAVYVTRYLPLATRLTGDASETLFDAAFSEALVRITIEAYEIWDDGDIATANILATNTINEMLNNYQQDSFIFIAD